MENQNHKKKYMYWDSIFMNVDVEMKRVEGNKC